MVMQLLSRKLPRRIALATVGAIACVLLVGVSAKFTVPVNEFFVAIAASVLVAGVAPLIVTLQRRLLRREMVGFFGEELIWKRLNLVYPEFVVHSDVVKHLDTRAQLLKYDKPDTSPYRRERHIDVERIVASNDIDALLQVAAIFKDVDENISAFSSDADALNECDLSFISFGLTSNDCTFMYLDKHRDKTLFEIMEESDGNVCLRLSNGTEYRNTDEDDYSVIVRYAPDSDVAGRRWFLVAGLGPRGTPAAGVFLAKHWRQLSKKVRGDRNFCAVVRTSAANIKLERGYEVYAP
jgi:hypothetical protein